MQRSFNPRIISKGARFVPGILTQTRSVRSRKKTREPSSQSSQYFYEIPNLLLDLDAWEAQNVRVYGAEDKAIQKKKWKSPNPDVAARRVEEFMQTVSKSEELLKSMQNAPFSPWRLTDYDLFSATLQGPLLPVQQTLEDGAGDSTATNASPTSLRPSAKSILDVVERNGIPRRIYEDSNRLLPWLMHWQTETSGNSSSNSQALLSALQQLSSVNELRRLVARLVQTDKGCKLVAKVSDKIALTCSRLTAGNESTALPFLNNLRIALRAHNVQLGAPLCNLGLLASAQAFELQALREFLAIGLMEGYWKATPAEELSSLSTALSYLLRHLIHRPSMPSGQASHDFTAEDRRLLFSVLTGWSNEASEPLPSFRRALPPTTKGSEAFYFYIHLLAELGALRTLCQERNTSFSQLKKPLAGSAPPASKPALFKREFIDVFSSAIYNASNSVQSFHLTSDESQAASNSMSTALDLDYISVGLQASAPTSRSARVLERVSLPELPQRYFTSDGADQKTLSSIQSALEIPDWPGAIKEFKAVIS
jgi:hypothetical protein